METALGELISLNAAHGMTTGCNQPLLALHGIQEYPINSMKVDCRITCIRFWRQFSVTLTHNRFFYARHKVHEDRPTH
jgi:hypothetical protein